MSKLDDTVDETIAMFCEAITGVSKYPQPKIPPNAEAISDRIGVDITSVEEVIDLMSQYFSEISDDMVVGWIACELYGR